MPPQDRWRLAARGALRWRRFDDGECIVHDERSGDTHRLGAAPAQAFVAFVQSPSMALDELVVALAPLDRATDVDVAELAAAAIAELARIGLIEAVAT